MVDDRNTTFHITPIDIETIYTEIFNLSTSKSSPKDSIPAKLIQENCEIFAHKIFIDFHRAIQDGSFPNNLKSADISPVFKKGDRSEKTNYRPVSILSPLSKIFERLLFTQINKYMDSKPSPYQCGFRKNMGTQNCLLFLIERWKKCLDKKGVAGVLLTDLSKAFDSLDHELLIAKLEAYGFDYVSLKPIFSYLHGRHQRVRINYSYSC